MQFNKKIQKNGLTILHEKRDIPVTTVMIATKYGYSYETEEEKGIAHFLEHLCFKGTKKRTTQQISSEIEKLGGILNAFTHEETTAYYATLPSEHFKTAMEVMFDIYFNPTFPEEEIEKEANVICEEIKMYRDSPQRHTLDKIKEQLYEKPFGITGAGIEENVRSMKKQHIQQKHELYYHPQNTILVVVGNNTLEEVEELTQTLTPNRTGKIPVLPPIKTKTAHETEQRTELNQANLALGIHFPQRNQKERYTAEVFSTILGQGMSSKLFSEIREKKGLVYTIKTDLDLGKNYGYLIIYAGTEPGKAEEVMTLTKKEYAKMTTITTQELEEAKIQVIGSRKVESEGSNERAINLLLEEITGKAEEYYDYEKHINEVTLQEIQTLAQLTNFSSYLLTTKH